MTHMMTGIVVLGASIGMAMNGWARAGGTATQTVTYAVQEVALISVSGVPGHLKVDAARPGSEPISATDAGATYSFTSNAGKDSKKITAALDKDLPSGVTLEVELASPDGNASTTKQVLSATPVDLVVNIDSVVTTNKTITYSLGATAEAGQVTSDSVIVTFTVTNQI